MRWLIPTCWWWHHQVESISVGHLQLLSGTAWWQVTKKMVGKEDDLEQDLPLMDLGRRESEHIDRLIDW